MRILSAVCAAIVVALTIVPAVAAARTVAIVVLTADRIAFYADRFVIRADGNVRVDLGTGTIVRASSFAMDLRESRFVVAGDVAVSGRNTLHAVALAEDLAADRAYAIGIGPGGPERTAYGHSDLTGGTVAAEPPADAFALPDVAGLPATFFARGATIGDASYLRFIGCRAQILGGFNARIPLPACYVNFGQDPNLAQNSLSGANVGAGYRFTGSANAISALIVNYDAASKLYGAVQENIAGPKAWAVASVYPLGNKDLVYSAIGAVQNDGTTGLRVSGQYHTVTTSATQPYGSYSYTDALVSQALPGAYAQLFASSENQTVDAAAGVVPNKDASLQLALTSSDLALGPLVADLRGGYGQQSDPFDLQTFGGVTYTSIWSDYLGASLRLPHVGIGDPRRPASRWYLDAGVDAQRQWNSLPHVITETTTSASLSHSFGRASAYLAYTIANVGDNYGAAQALAYPALPSVDTGYAAFDGFATFRTLSLQGAWVPRADFAITLTLRKHDDFPKPYAGFFVAPPLPALGQNPVPYVLGEPPYDVAATARFRINPQLSVDLQNTYYFNFGGRTWSGLAFQIRP
jgi:hypothetical protein